ITGDGGKLRDSEAAEHVEGSKTRVLLNDGVGVFTNETSSFFPAPKAGDDWGGVALAMGDLDDDGIDDLALVLDRVLYATVSGGTRRYLPSARVFAGGSLGFTDKTGSILPGVRSDGRGELWKAADVVIADPERNGRSDLFLVSEGEVTTLDQATGKERKRSSLRWLRNAGKLPLVDVTESDLPDPEARGDYFLGGGLVLGDVDGDADLDLLLTTDLAAYSDIGSHPTRLFEFR
ncbi:MAG: hypothetical protein ACYS99_10425, partial [Planctomycetota bacterium]